MWVKPAGTRKTSRQERRWLGLLSEIVGRNPPFPGRGPTLDLAEPPAAAVLFPDLEHRPLLEAAGILVSFKVGHSHVQVLRAVTLIHLIVFHQQTQDIHTLNQMRLLF